LDVARAYGVAENAHDVAGAVALFTDDAVIATPFGTFKGKDEIAKFVQSLADGNIKTVGRDYKEDGDKVSYVSAATTDGFTKLGIAPIDFKIDGVVRNGKIASWTVTYTALSAAKMFGVGENAHDVDAVVALFADDGVINSPFGSFKGKAEIRKFVQSLADGNIKTVARDYREDGDRVSYISAATTSDLLKQGVAPIDFRIDAVVPNGSITVWNVAYTPEAQAKINAAAARTAPAAQPAPPAATPRPAAPAQVPQSLPRTGGPAGSLGAAAAALALLASGVYLRRRRS
jgi:LPXTG-motif cell wall-anchored protein